MEKASQGDYTSKTRIYPSIIKRIQSNAIDVIIVFVSMFLFGSLLSQFKEEDTGLMKAIFLICAFFLYEPICTAYGCTFGNLIIGLRVRRFNDEAAHISIFSAFLRFIVKIFFGIISFFTIHTNPYGRAIHDFAAGSILIYANNMKNSTS